MEKDKRTLWYRLWNHKSDKEKKRLKSFIPLFLYTAAFIYGVIYLSILNTVNRNNRSPATVKSWFGGDREEVIAARKKEKTQYEASFLQLRKRVSGGR